jgi:rhomboid protease GluP
MSNNEESAESEDYDDVDPASADASGESTPRAWISGLSVVACVAIYLGISAQGELESWEAISKFGYLPADSVWSGAWWALVSSALVHFELWHLGFNVYWLWVLGSRLECAIGSLRYLIFVVLSAFVSSSFQLAVSGDTGIGASGVVYAIFGFMWATRHRFSRFNEVLDSRTIQIFVVWMCGCIAATYFDVWAVGNAAHVSGLLFGGAVAGTFVLRYRKRIALPGLAALILCSIVTLFWCPWSPNWLIHRAYVAHASEQYGRATDLYTNILRLDPENSWAYLNRGLVYQTTGDITKAIADYSDAIRLDPDNAFARYSRGALWAHQGEFDKAIDDCSEAIRIDPTLGVAYGYRGNAWLNRGEYEKAMTDCDEAIRLGPSYALWHATRGALWFIKGEYDKAIDDCDEAVRVDPSYGASYGTRGTAWQSKGDYAKAIADFKEAVRLDGNDSGSYNNLAWLQATCPAEEHRDSNAAFKAAMTACELTNWNESSMINTLSAACAASGEFGRAIEYLDKSIELNPDVSNATRKAMREAYTQQMPYITE